MQTNKFLLPNTLKNSSMQVNSLLQWWSKNSKNLRFQSQLETENKIERRKVDPASGQDDSKDACKTKKCFKHSKRQLLSTQKQQHSL
jgi:hypothetical protein